MSDVREHDRALRDGVWVDEFSMRDSGPRELMGWLFVAALSPLLLWIAASVVFRVIGG